MFVDGSIFGDDDADSSTGDLLPDDRQQTAPSRISDPSTSEKAWHHLSAAEMDYALSLGYDESSWESCRSAARAANDAADSEDNDKQPLRPTPPPAKPVDDAGLVRGCSLRDMRARESGVSIRVSIPDEMQLSRTGSGSGSSGGGSTRQQGRRNRILDTPSRLLMAEEMRAHLAETAPALSVQEIDEIVTGVLQEDAAAEESLSLGSAPPTSTAVTAPAVPAEEAPLIPLDTGNDSITLQMDDDGVDSKPQPSHSRSRSRLHFVTNSRGSLDSDGLSRQTSVAVAESRLASLNPEALARWVEGPELRLADLARQLRERQISGRLLFGLFCRDDDWSWRDTHAYLCSLGVQPVSSASASLHAAAEALLGVDRGLKLCAQAQRAYRQAISFGDIALDPLRNSGCSEGVGGGGEQQLPPHITIELQTARRLGSAALQHLGHHTARHTFAQSIRTAKIELWCMLAEIDVLCADYSEALENATAALLRDSCCSRALSLRATAAQKV